MADKNDLTARESEVLALAWQCFETEPKVDMNKLASLTGYTAGSALVTLGKIKRKLKAKAATQQASVSSGAPPATPKPKNAGGRPKTATNTPLGTPKSSATKNKRAAPADDTPSKRQKKGGREDEDEAETRNEDALTLEDVLVKKEEPRSPCYW